MMIVNKAISRAATLAGKAAREADEGMAGHLVYGPYSPLTQGVYEVGFTLALAREFDGPPERICLRLDVACDTGNRIVAAKEIHAFELSTEPRSFSLLFVLRSIELIEFRVATTGAANVFVAVDPAFKQVASILEEYPSGGLEHLGSLEDVGTDTRRVLRNLTPRTLTGYNKVRLGNPRDGGYVCVDDFEGIDTAFSFGINDDISWDLDAADRGLRIYQFDHTVADPAPKDDRMVFERKRIDRESNHEAQSLADLIHRHDLGRVKPNIILKMDIEMSEWPVIDVTPEEDWARIAWIVCELHRFQGLAEQDYRDWIDRCLTKMSRVFTPVHVHANVWGGIGKLGGVVFPNVIEATFANRRLYETSGERELFPMALDQSCASFIPDLYLGDFRF